MGLKFLDKYAVEGRHYDQKTEIDKALNDKDWSVRLKAIQHPNATEYHIDKALNDKDWSVRSKAIQHPNATEENIDKALNDKDWSVRSKAIQHPNATEYHIDKVLSSDVDGFVRLKASNIAKRNGWL